VQGDRNDVLHEIYRVRGGYRVDPDQYDFSQYRDPHFEWVTRLVAGWLNWSWDKDVLNPRTGEYHLADSLREAERLFGGYDVYMFWPFWPRAGFDARFQPDHYRNMPGGLTKLGEEIEAARDLGVRIILGHCIWSETDRDKSEAAQRASYRQLVDLACKLDADGVLMDIMATTPDEIREMARDQCHDLVPYQEWDPNWTQSQTNLVGRIHNGLPMPSFNLKRYMLPHHPQLRVCEPGHAGKVLQRDLVLSFLSGHGVEINTMFPQKQPETEHEWRTLARMLDILRINRACFASTQWRPMVRSKNSAAWINEWRSEHKTVYTICCTDPVGHEGPLLPVASSDLRYVDLWRYRPVEVVVNDDGDGDDAVAYRLDPYVPGRFNGFGDYTAGCIAAFQPRLKLSREFETLIIDVDQPQAGEVLEIWEDKVQPDGKPITRPAASRVDVDLYQALGHHTNKAIVVRLMDSNRQLQDVVVEPETNLRFFRIDRPEPTSPVDSTSPPKDMIRIPGGTFDYIVHHGAPTWHACYHTRYSYQPGPASRPKSVTLPAFWMDQYPVTNMQYAQFVEQTGYEPADDTNFLKHFVDGAPPENKENHPVVYVSYDDATAYAEWAGKRLPTEEEWQFAAGGTQGHPWPWGDEDPSAKRCNLEVDDTTPVNAHPAGSSPFGVEDLVGNVWQWTHSLTDNGRHWVVYLRGGSWYQPPRPTGGWWVKGGPRKINDHHPIPLFGPAMNRLATVGFRCVKDEAN
jgi:formylglycine-generating enzyme required for sulfatase activity